METNNENRVKWVYSSKDNSELSERYDEWARDYDNDLSEFFGWIAPETASQYLAKYVDRDADVLDAGAGTGLVGEALSELGFTQLTAMDLSKGMLEEADSKNVYKKLDQMVLGEKLNYPSDFFDANNVILLKGKFLLYNVSRSFLPTAPVAPTIDIL